MVRSALALVAASLLCAPARADLLSPTFQHRYTIAFAQFDGLPPDSDTMTAPDFGPFASVASASFGPQITASATQDTTITGSSIFGSCSAQSMSVPTNPQTSASASSILEVRFLITSTVDYDLSGMFSAFGSNQALANPILHLSQGDTNGPTIELVVAPSQSTASFQRTGTLQPGVYTLWANIFSSAMNNNSPYSVDLDFNFALTPSPGAWSLMLFGLIGPRRRR